MRIAFRTDASSQIGTGHVVRCLTLADALREQGAECQFICRAHEGHLIDHICHHDYQIDALPKPDANASYESGLAHASWLGVDWQTDADQTREKLGNDVFDWLIVDHYALDHRWESALRSSCNRIMVIDDLADRQHNCDLLLDQNYGSSDKRYRGLVSSDCAQCHGPEYALLKPVYAKQREQLAPRDGQVRRVLIYFGSGADHTNLTSLTVQAFQAPEMAHIELDIVVGEAYAHKSLLEELVAQRGKATIHRQLPDLAGLMVKADLAIGAGGATTWERCCMGLHAIVISVAENQRRSTKALALNGYVNYIGHFDEVTLHLLSNEIKACLEEKNIINMGLACMSLVSGLGASTIVKIMFKI